jgi:small GTP-binding protein
MHYRKMFEFVREYIQTMDVEVSQLSFRTNKGIILFYIWDVAGQVQFGAHQIKYYTDAKCAIIMFDLTSKFTYQSVSNWQKELIQVNCNIPIVFVGNKKEIIDRQVSQDNVLLQKDCETDYVEISVNRLDSLDTPFLLLTRKLLNDNEIEFLPSNLMTNQIFSS